MAISFDTHTIYHGFRLVEERFVPEIDSRCLHFEHIRSGARLLKVLNGDTNKTFCIGFKTLPESDNGAPHILEHSVLNGSSSFPVKSPFDVLLKGSLSTFLNAFTSKDYTMYPVASMNLTDYFNLMHVYLDAVFNPLIYSDPRILKQEGWHYELTDPDKPLNFTGVVYNEMKGSFSNPQRELWYHTFRHLFPDNAYGFESGGTPEAIPTLTEEQFLNFHRKYYHPENSYIFLYGDADTEQELERINTGYLERFEQTGNTVGIADQPPFGAMKRVVETYAVTESSDLDDKAFLTYNFVAGLNTDLALTLALDLLCEVLVNQESAPVRLALAEAGIGQDVSASSSNFMQHAVQIAAINANASDLDRFMEIIDQTLRKVATDGIDRAEVEGVLNRMEFRLREGDDAQKGLTYLNMALPRWFFAGDPIAGLAYEKPLAELKQWIASGTLEELVSRWFLDNPHSLLLGLEPAPGLERERAEQTEARLVEYKAKLSAEALGALVRETEELVAHQQRQDTPEALATVPVLKLSDIGRAATFFDVQPMEVSGVKVLTHERFTNDVLYVNLFFDLHGLPQELIPYAALLASLTGSLNTENYSYGALNQALNIHTGGFFTSLRTYLPGSDDNRLACRFVVTTKAMNGKVGKIFELGEEILGHSIYRDPERLRTVLTRHRSQLDSHVKGSGYHVASRRLASYFSNQGAFNELTGGLSYYWFIDGLVQNFDKEAEVIMASLERTAALVFNKTGMIVSVTGAAKDFPAFSDGLTLLAGQLPATVVPAKTWNLLQASLNEGLMAASNVQYVVKGFNYRKLGHEWNGRMRVLNQVLSTDWLQTRIRVVGGAYGGFSSISPGGNFTFNSYRDPNLSATLENFDATPGYLASFDADPETMARYIIGTVAELDAPLTNSQMGDQAVSMHFMGRTREDVQHDRDLVLSTTAADIRAFEELVREVLAQGRYCVYGPAGRLEAEAGLFGSLVRIEDGVKGSRL